MGGAAVTNILLSLRFVMGFGWSVEGAAWATVASQVLSAVLTVISLGISMELAYLLTVISTVSVLGIWWVWAITCTGTPI